MEAYTFMQATGGMTLTVLAHDAELLERQF